MFMYESGIPFNAINNEGFQRFVRQLDSLVEAIYQQVSTNLESRSISKKWKRQNNRLKNKRRSGKPVGAH